MDAKRLSACLLILLLPSPTAAQSLNHAGALYNAGKLREALQEYRALAANPATAATAFNNACVVSMNLGDYRGALPDCRRALALMRSAGQPDSLSRALNNLGLALQVVGEPAEAERLFREALALNRQRKDAEAEVVNLSNLGALALATGRYSAALTLHEEADALAVRHRAEPWAAEQSRIARLNKGVVLEKVGATREALDLYKGLLAEGEDMDPDRRAALRVNTGVLYRNLGDPVRAVAEFQRAMAEYGLAGDTAGLSNAHLNLGLALHLNLERPLEAEAAYREALRLAEQSGDRTEEVQDLFYLGRLLLQRGRLAEAEALYRRCLAVAEAGGSAEGRWSAREGLGRIARARDDLHGALASFQHALAEIERVRTGIARPRRAGYFGDKRAVYAAAVETLVELDRREPGHGWADRALEIVQRAKARDLLDALGSGRRPIEPLDAATLRARVGNGTVLEYFLGDTHLFLWRLQAGGNRCFDLGASGPVLAGVARLQHDLAHGSTPEPSLLVALSRVLLGPVRIPRGNALRIAPDGALHYLPFELLPDPAEPGVPLIERTAMSYLPSSSMLPAPAGEARRTDLRLLAFGDPRLRSRSPLATPRDLLVERFALAPLPATVREIATAGRFLGGRALAISGDRATEQAFREAVSRGARVVHIASHTVIDERRGAAILLTPAQDDDGLLSPAEIARLADRSELTVLAACRTALGTGDIGQALNTLTGSFLAAGSKAVVATLWDVGDAETAVFMEQFYWQLGRGLAPAEALRQAKRRLRQDPRWSRPALWAGYVLIGDAPAVVPRRWPWLWAGGLAALAVLGFSVWRWAGRAATRRPDPPLP